MSKSWTAAGLALLLAFIASYFLTQQSSDTPNMASTSSTLLKTLVVPAASGKASASVIFAHGLGDSGLGWIDVAKMLSARPALKHVRFILPNAPVQPVTLNMGMSMPSWFDITSLEDVADSEDENGLLKSAGEIKKLVQSEVDNEGVPSNRVVVGGFSQVSEESKTATSPSSGIVRSSPAQDPGMVNLEAISQAARETVEALSSGSPSSSIIGVGVDIMYRPRINKMLQRQRLRQQSDGISALDRFSQRILSRAEGQELARLRSLPSGSQDKLESWLALRWTAKEAAYKALYPLMRLSWKDLSVTKGPDGLKPHLIFSEESRAHLTLEYPPRLHLSGGAISYLAGLTSAQPVAGIIGLSTWLPLRSKISSMLQPHSSSTPIFHGHGNADPIVRYEFGQRTVNFVRKDLGAGEFAVSDGKAKGVRFETYNGMPHSACPEEIEHVGQFLEKIIPAQ